MNLYQIFLLGNILFQYVLLKDCSTGGDMSSVLVKTSDSIVFHFDEHGNHFPSHEMFILKRMQNESQKKRICGVEISIPGGFLTYEDCSTNSNNRTSVVLIYADKGHIIFNVTISNAEKADNGTYMISSLRTGILKCFTVFIHACPAINNPTDGTVSLSSGTDYLSEATFSCNTGYNLVGDPTRMCEESGLWSGTVDPTCEIVDCGDPGIAQSTFVPQVTTYGSSIFVTCNQGYTGGTGNGLMTCLDTGSWDNICTCDPVDCGPLTPPAGGTVNASVTTYQSVATFSCNTGYTLQGSETLICQYDTTWDNAPPTCQINDCGNLPDPSNGVTDNSAGTTYNSVAKFTCNTGYTLAGTGTSTCQVDKHWDNTDPNCQINDCGPPTSPPNGAVDTLAGTTYGQEATYTCDTGYNILGNSQVQCQAGGAWEAAPICQIVTCPAINNPTDGTVSLLSGTDYLSVATFSCNTGYNLLGDPTRTCEESGSWSGTVDPTCEIVDCGDPGIAQATFVPQVTTYGSSIFVTCNLGYTGGTGNGLMTCLDTGSWDNIRICDPVDCGPMTPPAGGTVDASVTTYQSVATFSCNTGYTLQGSDTLTCQDDTTWDNAPPTCQINEEQNEDDEEADDVELVTTAVRFVPRVKGAHTTTTETLESTTSTSETALERTTSKSNTEFDRTRPTFATALGETIPTSAKALDGHSQTFSQNNKPVAVVGGVLGAALLVAFVVIVVLLRRIKRGNNAASQSTTAEMELQNTGENYETLNHRDEALPLYDELKASQSTTAGMKLQNTGENYEILNHRDEALATYDELKASQSTTAEMELLNTGENNETLDHRDEASRTYDELKGIALAEDKGTSRAITTERGNYENTKITDTQ